MSHDYYSQLDVDCLTGHLILLAKQYKKSGAVDDLVGLFTFITFTLQHEGNLPLVVLRNFIYVYADIYKTYRDSVVLFLRTNIMVCNRIASKLLRVLAGGIHNLHQMSLKDKLETLLACDLMAQSVIGFAGIGKEKIVECLVRAWIQAEENDYYPGSFPLFLSLLDGHSENYGLVFEQVRLSLGGDVNGTDNEVLYQNVAQLCVGPLGKKRVVHFNGLVDQIYPILFFLTSLRQSSLAEEENLRRHLAAQGLCTTLVRALVDLPISAPQQEICIVNWRDALSLVSSTMASGTRYVIQAIQEGLFRYIFRASCIPITDRQKAIHWAKTVRSIFECTYIACADYAVLRALKREFKDPVFSSGMALRWMEGVEDAWERLRLRSKSGDVLRKMFLSQDRGNSCALHDSSSSIVCPLSGSSPKTMRCSGCRVYRYCSRSCQRKDWKHHRQICNELRDYRQSECSIGYVEESNSPPCRQAFPTPSGGTIQTGSILSMASQTHLVFQLEERCGRSVPQQERHTQTQYHHSPLL